MRYEVQPGEFAEVIAVKFLPGPQGCPSELARLMLGNGDVIEVDGPQAASLRREMTMTSVPVGSAVFVRRNLPDDR